MIWILLIILLIGVFGVYWYIRTNKERREEVEREDFEFREQSKPIELIEVADVVAEEPGNLGRTGEGLAIFEIVLPPASDGTPRRAVVIGMRAEKLAGRVHKGDRVRVRGRPVRRRDAEGARFEIMASSVEIDPGE